MPKPCVTLEHVLSQNSILSVLIQCDGRSSIRIPDLVINVFVKKQILEQKESLHSLWRLVREKREASPELSVYVKKQMAIP